MKKLTMLLFLSMAVFLGAGMISIASADIITITPLTQTQWIETNYPSYKNPKCLDIPGIVKFPGWETAGWTQDNNLIYYAEPSGEVSDYLITNDISIGAHTYLVVKDGNHVPRWYIFDLLELSNVVPGTTYSWNGTDDLSLKDFWASPSGGSISHVSICSDGGVPVPEPATLLLLGSGLIGLAGIGRKKFF